MALSALWHGEENDVNELVRSVTSEMPVSQYDFQLAVASSGMETWKITC